MVRMILAAVAALLVVAADARAQSLPFCDPIDPSVCLLPFPNDAFTREDPTTPTGRRLGFLPQAMPRNIAGKPIDPTEYNRADGFSPGTPIVIKVPGLDSQAAFDRNRLVPETDMARAFEATQRVVVIDVATGKRHPIWAELDSTAPTDRERVLIIRPAVNFEHGRRYIVALWGLVDANGKHLQPSAAFRAYRDGTPTLDPVIENRRKHMEGLFKGLEGVGIKREWLYAAWDFTVASRQDRTERMLHLRDEAFGELGDTNLADLTVSGKAPAFTVSGVEEMPTGDIARIVTGTFDVPCFLDKPLCVPGSRFAFATPDPYLTRDLTSSSLPVRIPGNVQKATFTCVVPRRALADPARPSLYGHGLLGGQGEVEAGNVKAMAAEHNFVFCATDWYGMATEDLPSVATILLDLSNFPLLADRVQQGMLAQMFLGRLMIHPEGLSSHEAFRGTIDRKRLFYDGNSQGGIIGGALMAVIPDADRGVLGVPAMNYSTLLNRSVDFETNPNEPCPPDPFNPTATPGISYACPMYAAYPNHLERQLLFGLIQQLWDRAEANGYAHHMTSDPLPNTPPHEVLMHVALGDHQVAQVAAEVQARTIGAKVRPVAVEAGRSFDVEPQWGIEKVTGWPHSGSLLEIWDSGRTPPAPVGNVPPREGSDPHGDPRSTVAARRQKSDFLRIGGRATDQCGGAPCLSRSHPRAG